MSEPPPPDVDQGDSLIPGASLPRRVLLVLFTLGWSFLCASPGLFGSWVYDDLRMVDNPCYDGWEDVLATARRTAPDYLLLRDKDEPVPRGSETYRPMTMLTLVVTHVVSPTPMVHHLVGWTLHVVISGLLLLGVAWTLRRAGLRPGFVPWCLATVFLLHPIGVEAYVWIHGRSDVTAAAFVALTALVAFNASSPTRHRLLRHPAALALAAFVTAALALGSKETALGAVVGVWAAAILVMWQQPDDQRDAKSAWLATAAAMLGVAAYFVAWYVLQPEGAADAGRGGAPFSDTESRLFAPKLLAIGVGALLSLEALPMQSYVWLAFRALTPVEWVGAGLALAFVAYSAWKRDYRGLALTVGAALTLLPTVVLTRSLWLGRDRYLYMPLLLLLLALAPLVANVVRKRSERLRFLPGLVFVTIALTASASTAVGSGYYKDQHVWMTSGLQPETGDPTRYLFAAQELANNHVPGPEAFLAEMPPPPWPLVVSIGVINVASMIGDRATYDRTLAQAERDYPHKPEPRVHRMHERMRAGDIDAVLRIAPTVMDTEYCPEAARALRQAATLTTLSDDQQRLVGELQDRLTCQWDDLY